MHKYLPKIYYFVDKLNIHEIKNLNKKIAIIYRNYSIKPGQKELIKFKNFCLRNNHKFLISNYPDLVFKYKLDGFYIPSFNRTNILKKYQKLDKFIIAGSAHNHQEIKIKEQQGVDLIFLSPIFKIQKNKKFLDIVKFNFLKQVTNKKIIALGGIKESNINKIKMTNSYGFASISYIKKNKLIKK